MSISARQVEVGQSPFYVAIKEALGQMDASTARRDGKHLIVDLDLHVRVMVDAEMPGGLNEISGDGMTVSAFGAICCECVRTLEGGWHCSGPCCSHDRV